MPKLVLITASSPEIRKARKTRVLNFQQITMPYLAARVPPRWNVIHVDEEAEEIDWNIDADVVGKSGNSAFVGDDLGRPGGELSPGKQGKVISAVDRAAGVLLVRLATPIFGIPDDCLLFAFLH